MIPSFLSSFDGNCYIKKVDRFLCSLLDDLLDKYKGRVVESCDYLSPFFDTFCEES